MKFTYKIFILLIIAGIGFLIPMRADTIKHMQYNLLYYTTNGVDACNESTNNLDAKDANLKTIIKYVMPDVLTVNEIGKETSYADRILNNVLNTDGVNYYAYCPVVSNTNSYITIGNRLFYDTRKLALKSSFYVSTSVTYFNAYRMYYRSAELERGDTAFITFIICHLKAGSYDDNVAARYTQVQALMNRLGSIGIADNYVLSGDMNLYRASEDAYQHLIHHSNSLIRFYDPIDQEGEWGSNYNYRHLHTQSTHNDNAECFSSGGLDDRFDIILVSNYIKNNLQKVKSLDNTYQALGQDGNHYNSSLLEPNNTAVPANIATALYNMSDHLPVILQYQIDATAGITETDYLTSAIQVANPVGEQLNVFLDMPQNDHLVFEIYSIEGRLLHRESQSVTNGSNQLQLDFSFPASIYLLKIFDTHNHQVVKKIVKF
ncbi:MAG: T9SS type A sorting domain-containing protein [Bacteroidales bacterium]|nr:T9SS type A sorting domain-containing protein [Bacteroidales bacterium]